MLTLSKRWHYLESTHYQRRCHRRIFAVQLEPLHPMCPLRSGLPARTRARARGTQVQVQVQAQAQAQARANARAPQLQPLGSVKALARAL